MRSVSAALRAAIDSSERIIDGTFTVDWDNDGLQPIDDLSRKVTSISLNQSLESSLPAQVQLVPGVAVAELTAQISQGNTTRYTIPATYRALTTSSADAATTTWTISRPAGAKEGDVILVAIFASLPGPGSVFASWQVLRSSISNVTWLPMSVRGDGALSATARCEGLLLYRRVSASEPATYTITLPANSSVTYASAAVNVGEQFLMGITDFTQKGEDSDLTPTGITLPQVRVDVPGSTVVSFFGAASYAVSGIGFSPLDPNDVEQTEFTQAGTAKPSLRVAVTTHANAVQGLYQKGITFTGSAGGNEIATIGFSVVLAPRLAGDEAQHAAWTFSELNANSPYAGKTRLRRRTQWALRFVTPTGGFESVPLFTGLSTAPSANSRVATLKALDNRETMRNIQQGLDIAAEYPESLDFASGLQWPTLPGLESTWIVSRAFFLAYWSPRFNTNGIFTYESQIPQITGLGYFPSPLANQYSSVWATLHGSAHLMFPRNSELQYAFTQNVGGANRRRIKYDAGPFVASTRNEPVGTETYMSWLIGNWVPWNQTTGQIIGRLQCWVRRNQTTSALDFDFPDNNGFVWDAWVEVLTGTGVTRFRVEKPSVSRTIVGPTVPADGQWHFLGVHFDSVAGSVRFRLDNTNTDVAMATWADATIPFIIQTANPLITDGFQLAELQVSGGYSSGGLRTGIVLSEPWANENFTPTAFVDKSENLLDVMPAVDPTADTFTLVSDIAAAEFAAFFFDADGYPHFRNSRSDASTTGQTVQRSITSRKNIQDIEYESGVLQVRNVISVGYTPYAATIGGQIFSASGAISVQPGTTITFKVTTQGPIVSTNAPTYTAFSLPDGTGTDLTAFVNVNQLLDVANQVTLEITNNSSFIAWLVNNTGQPNLSLTGTFFTPLNGSFAPVSYSDLDSIREFGDQSLDVGNASSWIQREDSAAMIALKLLSDLCQPHPVITSLPIKGDPTLEFGDLTTILDPNSLGVNGRFRITAMNPQLDTSGFSQTLTVRGAPGIAFWDTNFWDDGFVWG